MKSNSQDGILMMIIILLILAFRIGNWLGLRVVFCLSNVCIMQ